MKHKPNPVDLLVEVCHRLYENKFVTATDGNISVRTGRGTFLTTCTLVNKGNVVSGAFLPSTELKMHLFIYKRRKDVNAVVHAHPPYATGFAVEGIPFPDNVLPEVIVNIGKVPLAAYGTPGTDDLANSLAPYINHTDAILLANHGVVTYGKDIWDAYYKLEKVEHAAKICFIARMLGGEKSLSARDIKELIKVKMQPSTPLHIRARVASNNKGDNGRKK
jgi:L-fuculose-phosphate aldolase